VNNHPISPSRFDTGGLQRSLKYLGTMGLTTLQPLAYAVAYITFFLGTASIFLRFYCRYFVLQTWGVDDLFAILILVVSIAQQVNLHGFLYSGCGL
jgi:hypothetical protein